MKKYLLLLVFLLSGWAVQAQDRPPFNPEKFDAEMEQFIATDACLSPQEAARFFPLFKEMQRKQHALFDQMRQYRFINTDDDAACLKAIKKQDEIDIQLKKIQQQYHQKFLRVLPAGKLMRVIKAEDKFHRRAFMRAMKYNRGKNRRMN